MFDRKLRFINLYLFKVDQKHFLLFLLQEVFFFTQETIDIYVRKLLKISVRLAKIHEIPISS